MIFVNLTVTTSILLYFYMFLYNLTLAGLFWVLKALVNSDLKTLFSFNMFSFDSFYLFFLTLFLFSLAGVPPFAGFFSKLFLLDLLVEFGFFTLYFLFCVILLLGLYFYIQNLRFLHSTNFKDNTKPYLVNERVITGLYYYLVFQALVLVNGVFVVEDFLFFFSWLLI